jgi:hypothetical protein
MPALPRRKPSDGEEKKPWRLKDLRASVAKAAVSFADDHVSFLFQYERMKQNELQ